MREFRLGDGQLDRLLPVVGVRRWWIAAERHVVYFLEILANAFQFPHIDGDCLDDYPRLVVPRRAFRGDSGIVGCLPKVVGFAVREELLRPISVVASVIALGRATIFLVVYGLVPVEKHDLLVARPLDGHSARPFLQARPHGVLKAYVRLLDALVYRLLDSQPRGAGSRGDAAEKPGVLVASLREQPVTRSSPVGYAGVQCAEHFVCLAPNGRVH